MQKLIHYLGIAALSLFVTSLIGATLGASTMGSIWLTTRVIDHAERAAIREAKEVEARRETGRDREPQGERPNGQTTWARYEQTGEIVDTAALDAMLPEREETAVQIKPDAVAQYQEKRYEVAH